MQLLAPHSTTRKSDHVSEGAVCLHWCFPLCVAAVSPKITEISSDISINEGGNVSLTCIATGRPDPTITWRHISPKGKRQKSPKIPQEGLGGAADCFAWCWSCIEKLVCIEKMRLDAGVGGFVREIPSLVAWGEE